MPHEDGIVNAPVEPLPEAIGNQDETEPFEVSEDITGDVLDITGERQSEDQVVVGPENPPDSTPATGSGTTPFDNPLALPIPAETADEDPHEQLEHTLPDFDPPPDPKKYKDDMGDLYRSFFSSCPLDAFERSKDKFLLDHLHWQSEMIQEGLNHLHNAEKAFHAQKQANEVFGNWTKQEAHIVIPGPWKRNECFFIDLRTQEAFKVDTDTDILSEKELYENWDKVEAADRKELKQFVENNVWKAKRASDCKLPPVDAIWVRKWKRQQDGTLVVKSRLCARGFLDMQGPQLTTRATTATKLSQKLLLALSQIFGLELESWDVSGAFLKGFPFREIEERLKDTQRHAVTCLSVLQ